MEISAALRLRPLAGAPLVVVVVEAEVAFLPFAFLPLAAGGEGEAAPEDEEVVGVLKPFLMVLYCWLVRGSVGVSGFDGW